MGFVSEVKDHIRGRAVLISKAFAAAAVAGGLAFVLANDQLSPEKIATHYPGLSQTQATEVSNGMKDVAVYSVAETAFATTVVILALQTPLARRP